MSTTLRAARRSARSSLAHTRRVATVALVTAGMLSASALAYAVGIDISHWQGSVNWAKVKADGVTFAFMKATEGSTYTDPRYAANTAAAQKVGIYHAGYHFARPAVGTAAAQARHFASEAGPFTTAGTLPPVLDLEVTGGLSASSLRTWTANWLSSVEKLTGRTPMIYTSPSFWESHMGDSTAFHHYPLWVAHWGVSAPRVPGGWPTWTFWQRTDSGTVDGIAGRVDMNRFHGTSAQLATLARTTGGSTDPVPPGPTVPTVDPTAVTIGASTTKVATINGPVQLAGDLTTTPTGTTTGGATPSPVALADSPVDVYTRPKGTSTWKKIASTPTDADGHYSVDTTVLKSSDYQARWAGDADHAASVSPVVSVAAPPRTRLSLDLHTTKTRVARANPVMLYGHLTRTDGTPVAGRSVRLYKKRLHGGPWLLVGRTGSLAPTGWFSWTVHPLRARVYKAVVRSTDYVVGDTSGWVTVRLR